MINVLSIFRDDNTHMNNDMKKIIFGFLKILESKYSKNNEILSIIQKIITILNDFLEINYGKITDSDYNHLIKYLYSLIELIKKE